MANDLTPTSSRAHLTQLAKAARGYAEAGMADNTRRAYGSDWADFASWCASVGACPLPADPATIALYLTARAPHLATSTLARHLAAIRTAHREARHEVPSSVDLDRVWAGIRRDRGRPPRKKRALKTADLRKVLAGVPTTTERGLRDRALLLVGFAAALRRSELAAIELEGPDADSAAVRCSFVSQGLQIALDRSKADQEGEGAIVGVPFGKTSLCPVSALRAWLKAADITRGPVFRAIDRHGRISRQALTGKAVGDIVKAAVVSAGFDPREFAGHSLRAGLITSAIAAGVAPDVVMRQSRHSRFDTMRGYVREGERFSRNAASKVGL